MTNFKKIPLIFFPKVSNYLQPITKYHFFWRGLPYLSSLRSSSFAMPYWTLKPQQNYIHKTNHNLKKI